MPNEYITNFQRYGMQPDVATGHTMYCLIPRHAMSAGCDFNSAVRRCDGTQAKADKQHVRGEMQVRILLKEWPLIIDMNVLIIGASQWHIATPLVGNYPLAHTAPDNA
jgi:hypothetical protein